MQNQMQGAGYGYWTKELGGPGGNKFCEMPN